jgi:hypothetical protein
MSRPTLGRMMMAGMTVGAMSIFAPADARAACVAGDAAARGGSTAARALRMALPPPTIANGSIDAHGSIVGLWNTTFLFGSGPEVYDQGFQQWHGDNTEMMVDNAVPPSLGNVCVGVWKQTGPRSYTLKHVTFNWDNQGALAGTFVLKMTVTLERRGNVFSGSYTADSFDLEGKVIPDLHVEGNVRGQRITVH